MAWLPTSFCRPSGLSWLFPALSECGVEGRRPRKGRVFQTPQGSSGFESPSRVAWEAKGPGGSGAKQNGALKQALGDSLPEGMAAASCWGPSLGVTLLADDFSFFKK